MVGAVDIVILLECPEITTEMATPVLSDAERRKWRRLIDGEQCVQHVTNVHIIQDSVVTIFHLAF